MREKTREKRKRNLMNVKFKHKNPDLVRVRDTIITEECLGKYDAVTLDPKTKEQVDVKLKVGESQKSFFPASLDDFEARDYFYVNTEKKDVKAEDLVGKPKGMRQLLFERGCLESHTAKLTKPEAIKLLGNMPDYAAEENKFTRDVRRRGHRAIMSPIAHPELAGNGIEFAWGFSKMHYRRKNQQNGFTKGIDPSSLFVVVWTVGTIVSMDWNKRIGSLDERETTLEYIEESTLLRVLSILSAFERRRRVIAVDQATSFVSQEVEETTGQFDEAEAAVERLLEAQQHTDTTTTTT